MNLRCLFSTTLILLILGYPSIAQDRILVDEAFTDWQQINPIFIDGAGDGADIDFKRLWITSDAEYLFLRLELDQEINLQNDNNIRIHIDTDNDSQTGTSFAGIGADLSYYFGERWGHFGFSSPRPITHSDIGLVTSPTVTSSEFEIAIRRDITISGQTVFTGNSIRVVFEEYTFQGDHMPETQGGLSFAFDNTPPGSLPAFSFEKTDSTHLRILAYNVLSNGPWDNQRGPAFEKILSAINPDIMGFQEIYQYSSLHTRDKVAAILQNQYAGPWYHSKMGPDIIAVSKYPILSSHFVAGNGAFLLDLGDKEMLFIVAHPPCCSNDIGRQDEFDAMMAFVRNAKDGFGPLTLKAETPIVIAGDMNLVGLNRQVATLLNGDIRNNGIYGLPFDPDWDQSPLEDAKPPTTGMPMVFTWYNEGSSFSPGRLDYVVYSGSVMELKNSYSLFTPGLDANILAQHGLQPDESTLSSDHLPLVADFEFPATTAITSYKKDEFHVEWFPNPVQTDAQIRYQLKEPAFVKIELFDGMGRRLRVLENAQKRTGSHFLKVNLKGVAPGVYVCTFLTETTLIEKRIVLLR